MNERQAMALLSIMLHHQVADSGEQSANLDMIVQCAVNGLAMCSRCWHRSKCGLAWDILCEGCLFVCAFVIETVFLCNLFFLRIR